MRSIGFITMPAFPRGVRKGSIFAHKRNVVQAGGRRDHRVVALCSSEADARVTAAVLHRRYRRAR